MKRFILSIFIFIGCHESSVQSNQENTSWIFVANEGNYSEEGFSGEKGSISMIDSFGNINQVQDVGYVVQSLEVYENQLIVLVNGDHLIKIYDITENGLTFNREISTNNSSPRELIVYNNKIYFTNWNTQDVKILNLSDDSIESISVPGLPEDIIIDGNSLWITIPNLDFNWTTGNQICQIDINTKQVQSIEVGEGPQQLTKHNGAIYISRTFYDENWNTSYGSSKIANSGFTSLDYGVGVACGGSVMNFNNKIYLSHEGGISPLNHENLEIILDEGSKIGNYNQNHVYHVEIINNNVWFALTDYSDFNEIRVVDSNGLELAVYTDQIGVMPGDFAVWNK